nr:hypothetical protein BOH68_03795 [Cobetia sp. MM1IDA2H-1]
MVGAALGVQAWQMLWAQVQQGIANHFFLHPQQGTHAQGQEEKRLLWRALVGGDALQGAYRIQHPLLNLDIS